MRTLFNCDAVVKNDDFIAIAHGGKSVRHDDTGYPPVFYRIYDVKLGFFFERAQMISIWQNLGKIILARELKN